MAMSHIHESEFANRYLAGTLSDTERAVYEPQLVLDADARRELEATARLKVGLARLRENGELEELLRAGRWERLRPPLAVAAAFVLAAVGIALYQGGRSRDMSPPLLAASATGLVDAQGGLLPVTGTFALFRKRVEGADATLEATAAPQAVQLRVLPITTVPSGDYRVTLARVGDDRAGVPVASIAGLHPAEDGFLDMYVDASRLSVGSYQLDVVGQAAGRSTVSGGTFSIQVNPPKTN
jgi:hypothetical protein